MRAASPRAATSSTIARAASSTSSETSRFVAMRAAKAREKPGSRASRRCAMSAPLRGEGRFRLVLRAALRLPDRAEILHLHLDAFDLDLDRSALGEDERDGAGGRVRLLKGDG